MAKYSKFFIDGIPSRRVTIGSLEICLLDGNKTVQRRPYRLSESEKKVVKEKIRQILEANVLKKKNGSYRLCIDYQKLRYIPLLLISDQVDRLQGGLYFSSLDMASGFYHFLDISYPFTPIRLSCNELFLQVGAHNRCRG